MFKFKVILPEYELFSKESEYKFPVSQPYDGTSIGATMLTRCRLFPRDVNYSHTDIAEDNSDLAVMPQEVNGHFQKIGGSAPGYPLLKHPAAEGWQRCDGEGEWTDTAGYPAINSYLENGLQKWMSGGFHWMIPIHVQGAPPMGTSQRSKGDGKLIGYRKQNFLISVNPSPIIIGQNNFTLTFKCEKDFRKEPYQGPITLTDVEHSINK